MNTLSNMNRVKNNHAFYKCKVLQMRFSVGSKADSMSASKIEKARLSCRGNMPATPVMTPDDERSGKNTDLFDIA